ncbi:SPOR domain-containing protein [Pseudomonas putida]|uniref:SPOR domain-containing protein n=1 Tax=Pseudomonas putida TaxID=303 RepID=UPI00370C186E
MRKLGLSFLVIGIFGHLSALLWTYASWGPICQDNLDNSSIQQEVTKFEQLIDDVDNKITTELSGIYFDALAHLTQYESQMPDPIEADSLQLLIEKPVATPEIKPPSSPASTHKWMIIISALITFFGLPLALFVRKKNIDPQWHVFRTVPNSLITLERRCLTCGGYISPPKNKASTIPTSGLWVVEIAMNTPNRHRAIKAIQNLSLPIARRENNFVVIGPYKKKQDAARVVKELSESHGIRGWVMPGN